MMMSVLISVTNYYSHYLTIQKREDFVGKSRRKLYQNSVLVEMFGISWNNGAVTACVIHWVSKNWTRVTFSNNCKSL